MRFEPFTDKQYPNQWFTFIQDNSGRNGLLLSDVPIPPYVQQYLGINNGIKQLDLIVFDPNNATEAEIKALNTEDFMSGGDIDVALNPTLNHSELDRYSLAYLIKHAAIANQANPVDAFEAFRQLSPDDTALLILGAHDLPDDILNQFSDKGPYQLILGSQAMEA